MSEIKRVQLYLLVSGWLVDLKCKPRFTHICLWIVNGEGRVNMALPYKHTQRPPADSFKLKLYGGNCLPPEAPASHRVLEGECPGNSVAYFIVFSFQIGRHAILTLSRIDHRGVKRGGDPINHHSALTGANRRVTPETYRYRKQGTRFRG